MQNLNSQLSNKPRDSQSTAVPYSGTNASMFSEKQVKRIITDYNTTLESIIKENDMLEMDNQQLERNIFAQSKKVCEFKAKNQQILIEQEYYSTLIKEYLEQMKENQTLFEKLCSSIGETKEKSLLMNFEEDDIDQDNQKVSSTENNYNIRKEIQTAKIEQFKLNSLAKYLTNQNNQLKSELNKYILDKITPKLCVVCGETYNPSENTEKSCVYHPGKLKYFSCRGCGKDEYYTCCLYCSQCKKGCRMKKHMSEL